MKSFRRTFPWMVAGLAGLIIVTMALSLAFGRGDPPDELHLNKFGRIPVVHNGRVMPINTMADLTLMQVSSRSTYRDAEGKKQPAIRWLLDSMTGEFFGNPAMAKHKVIRIENLEVLDLLGLKARPGSYRYSIEEITAKNFKAFYEQATKLRRAMQARQVTREELSVADAKILELETRLVALNNVSKLREPRFLPPEAGYKEWAPLFNSGSYLIADDGQKTPQLAKMLVNILQAYTKGETKKFNSAVDEYYEQVESLIPSAAERADFEDFFTRLQPFKICLVSYLIIFIMACCSWLGWMGPLNRAAFWLGIVTFVVHMWALFARMYLLDRQFVFVTNLYSSAIFISWIGVYTGLFLEAVYRNGFGNAVAGMIGFSTLIVAHNLSSGGDTLEVMQAVLDTNFWLATHVTVVTIGYAATFVAGALGICYIVRGILGNPVNRLFFSDLGRMIYGVVCFATLFSFVGTVLGGIWADQSWGRFWGWDPKENGALIIVLWNALILHARWAGLVKHRGVATLAVFGNVVTIWSWFGVNMLGVGLHSYGFIPGAVIAIAIIVGLHLAIIGLGWFMPIRHWRAFRRESKPDDAADQSNDGDTNGDGDGAPVAKKSSKRKRSKSITAAPAK